MVLVPNLLGHSDVPDVDMAELEWEVSSMVAMAPREVIGGPPGNLKSAKVGPMMAACLHSLVNVGAEVAKSTRRQATTDTPDYKYLQDIVDRNEFHQVLTQELVEATKVVFPEWRGGLQGPLVRERDQGREEEDPRAESRQRHKGPFALCVVCSIICTACSLVVT